MSDPEFRVCLCETACCGRACSRIHSAFYCERDTIPIVPDDFRMFIQIEKDNSPADHLEVR